MTNNSLMKVSLKWGLIYACILILTFVGVYAFGLGLNKAVAIFVGILTLIINVLVLVIANKEYRVSCLGGYIKYGQCFVNSLLVSIISLLIYSIFCFLMYQVIDPEWFDGIIVSELLKIDQREGMPAEIKQVQVDLWVNMTPIKYVVGFQLIGGVIGGAILALIVSAFTHKKNNTFEGAIKEIE